MSKVQSEDREGFTVAGTEHFGKEFNMDKQVSYTEYLFQIIKYINQKNKIKRLDLGPVSDEC